MPRTDAGAATPRRDADDTHARDAACRERWPVRLARLVVAVASLLACPWAIPEADAARGADARGAAVGGQHRREAAAVRAGPARAAPPAVRQRQAGSSRRIVATAAGKAAAAARPDPANNAGAPVSPAVSRALDRAARATGADPALLLAMAWKESRFDPAARNPLSSARGLMQFTRATWLEAVRDFGPRHGLAGHAALLSTDRRDGLRPSSAPAMASIRVAVRGFRSRRASARSCAGLAKSVRISSAAPIGLSLAIGEEGITATAKPSSRESQSLRSPV